MIKEFKLDVLDRRKWLYYYIPVIQISEEETQYFDEGFKKIEKNIRRAKKNFIFISIRLYNEFPLLLKREKIEDCEGTFMNENKATHISRKDNKKDENNNYTWTES